MNVNDNKQVTVGLAKCFTIPKEIETSMLDNLVNVDNLRGLVYLTPMSRPRNDENKVEQKATTT